MKKANTMGTYFIHGKRHEHLMDTGKVLRGIPNIRIKVAHNGTRIAARHSLLYSEVRLNIALKMYGDANKCDWVLTNDEWRTLGEFEAGLNITRITSTLMQYETIFPGAYGFVLKTMAIEKLRSGSIEIIQQDLVTASPTLPRVATPVSTLSENGKTCRRRALVEG
jgi:hypothetical protein